LALIPNRGAFAVMRAFCPETVPSISIDPRIFSIQSNIAGLKLDRSVGIVDGAAAFQIEVQVSADYISLRKNEAIEPEIPPFKSATNERDAIS
jgi:hypothetical protein